MRLIKLPPLANVAASSTAVGKWTDVRGLSIVALVLKLGGTFVKATHISRVDVKSGGKKIVDQVSGAQLQDLNDVGALGDETGYLTIPFGDPAAKTIRGMHLGNVDGDVYPEGIDLEVAIGAATSPTLEWYALVAAPKAQLGFSPEEQRILRALLRTQYAPAAAVTKAAFDVAYGAGSAIRGVHIFHANLTELTVKKAGVPIHEEVPNALNTSVLEDFGRVAQSGLYSFLPTASGDQSDAVATLDEKGRPYGMNFLVTTSGADTLTAFADVYNTRENL